MKRIVYIFLLGAGLTACSFGLHKFATPQKIEVKSGTSSPNKVDSLIAPYKVKLDAEMNEIIGEARVNFVNGKPSSNLGNLISDVYVKFGIPMVSNYQNNVICVLNYGGLRSPINQGKVTLGDLYKVLPFDNELVMVHIPKTAVPELIKWLTEAKGHPIAGCKLEDGKLTYTNGSAIDKDFWIVSSDYLLNGGDNAHFFQQKYSVIHTGKLMRDVFIDFVRENKILEDKTEVRIKL